MKLYHPSIVNAAFQYVIKQCKKYSIDDSHALKHSMEVFHIANNIYSSECNKNKFLIRQKNIIDVASIVHDMCDKKYVNVDESISEMNTFMKTYLSSNEMQQVNNIITTMSYSHIKKYGFPDHNAYQHSYNIVREADLLASYDIDRCIIYGMMKEKIPYNLAVKRAIDMTTNRVLTYKKDNLFTTEYAINKSAELHAKCVIDLNNLINFVS